MPDVVLSCELKVAVQQYEAHVCLFVCFLYQNGPFTLIHAWYYVFSVAP